MAAIALNLAEQRDLVRAALVDATCREMRVYGGSVSTAIVAAHAARRVRDSMPVRSTYFYRLVALELRDLTVSGIRPWEWTR
jgi:hypothetical protein